MKNLLIFLLFPLASMAHDLNVDKDDCLGEARNALVFAEHRDLGTGKEIALHMVEMGVAQAYGTEGSYLKDEEDVKRVLQMVSDIWDSSDSPGQVYDKTVKNCNAPTYTKMPKGTHATGHQAES
jgi:hypothetical protein